MCFFPFDFCQSPLSACPVEASSSSCVILVYCTGFPRFLLPFTSFISPQRLSYMLNFFLLICPFTSCIHDFFLAVLFIKKKFFRFPGKKRIIRCIRRGEGSNSTSTIIQGCQMWVNHEVNLIGINKNLQLFRRSIL